MSKSKIKLRYLSCQSYEIIMPNGKHLLTDPAYGERWGKLEGYGTFTADQIKQCDYILLSHTHIDHIASIKEIVKKYEPKVFLGAKVVDEMSRYMDVDYDLLYPMTEGQTYEFKDIKVTAYHFRHNHAPKSMSRTAFENRGAHEDISDLEKKLNLLGSLECLDFCVTFPNNLRLMLMAGKTELENPYRIAQEFRPNIVFRTMLGRWSVEHYAEVLNRYGAQLALPHHQDACINKHGKWTMEYSELQEKVSAELERIGSLTTYFCPEPFKWYDVDLGITLSAQ